MTNYAPRPTVYKGIQMRSRLEAGFAAWLDKHGLVWEYEPRAFAGEAGQYLPDFQLSGVRCSWLRDPATVYVETKPKKWSDWDDVSIEAHENLMRRMGVIWESEPEAVLVLCSPGQLLVLDKYASPNDSDPYPWPIIAEWVVANHGAHDLLAIPGLAFPWPDSWHPWPHEYWKGRR